MKNTIPKKAALESLKGFVKIHNLLANEINYLAVRVKLLEQLISENLLEIEDLERLIDIDNEKT